jgi:hypothetical protein
MDSLRTSAPSKAQEELAVKEGAQPAARADRALVGKADRVAKAAPAAIEAPSALLDNVS